MKIVQAVGPSVIVLEMIKTAVVENFLRITHFVKWIGKFIAWTTVLIVQVRFQPGCDCLNVIFVPWQIRNDRLYKS